MGIELDKLSEELLLSVKMQKDSTALQQQLQDISLEHLKSNLNNDNQKKAFWINLYNAYFLILRRERNVDKPEIYKKKLISIANHTFSLDDFEHGILRRFRYKKSRGFFASLFPPKLIKQLAVDKLDYRIHFALNCGAKSCPPIAFYESDQIQEQLNRATQVFLEGESDFDDQKKEVHTTALFKWFFRDFGGTKGIKKIFKEQINKDISRYSIKYKAYSWEEDLGNFVEG